MTTERKLLAINGGYLAMALLIAALAQLTHRTQQQLTAANENRYLSFQLATELRQSSDDLTRLARTYVVTGDPRYEDAYWHVLAVRNGRSPRADGTTVSLRDLMVRAGFTAEEFAQLKKAEDNSNSLVTTETIAMNAVKGRYDDGHGNYTREAPPDRAMAQRIMHDQKYHDDKAAIMAPIDQFQQMLDARTRAAVEYHARRRDTLFWATAAVVPVIVLLSIVGFWLIRYRIVRPLNGVIANLETTSQTIDSAVGQIAETGQTLASSASSQAASLEETGASLEEMSSMTQRNADHAQKAKEIATQTRAAAETGAADMQEMTDAMAAMKTASNNIAKIIQTIDEIAFQTNILALNAAVEAARAGDAGMGFAVVAEEVRNLAQRSAQAARETASRIEESIQTSERGVSISAKVATSLGDIVAKARQVDELVAEIATASSEQSDGITQLNRAVSNMDKVTQENASTAEESANASQELSAQTVALRHAVDELLLFVGNGASTRNRPAQRPGEKDRRAPFGARNNPGVSEHSSARTAKSVISTSTPRASAAAQVVTT